MKFLEVGLGLIDLKEHCARKKKTMGNVISACCGIKEFKRYSAHLKSVGHAEECLLSNGGNQEIHSIASSQLVDDDEEFEPIKNTYASLKEYQVRMAYQMFLEEQTYLSEEASECLTSQDCKFSWNGGKFGDHTYKGLHIEIPMTEQFLNTYLSKIQQDWDQYPFYREQTMLLMLENQVPWYAYVHTIYSKVLPGKSFRTETPKILKIFVKIYDWDRKSPPERSLLKRLRILPCSVGISRAFKAMTLISNPMIVRMILGKDSVEQKYVEGKFEFSQKNLNASQKRAISSAMSNSITILQGPPGTGKTHIITEMVIQLLKQDVSPIMIVASSNMAVDNIAEKLLPEHKDIMLRVVAASRESKYDKTHELNPVCLHTKVRQDLSPAILKLLDRWQDSSAPLTKSENKAVMNARNPVSGQIVSKSKIILTTTVVAGGALLKKILKLPVVIMDEATQSPEYSSLIPLAFPGIEKIMLVGDQKQLSGHAEIPALAVSLFERVIGNGTYKPAMMLDVQYRMHPKISKFPRCKIYRGLLKDGITCKDRSMEGIPEDPVVFWDTQGKHPESFAIEMDEEEKKHTYCNLGEVQFVKDVLVHLIKEKKVCKSNIGIIAPYGGQRSLISSIIAMDERINPKKEEVQFDEDCDQLRWAKASTIHLVSGITVASIDGFQGREKDFIIISCVRSNDKNNIGFLSDVRRLNVALTRARFGLILVGDIDCLRQGSPFWENFIEYMEAKGSVLRSPEFIYGSS